MATLLTQVIVDPDDPAFTDSIPAPSDHLQQKMRTLQPWTLDGAPRRPHVRRVVASPGPSTSSKSRRSILSCWSPFSSSRGSRGSRRSRPVRGLPQHRGRRQQGRPQRHCSPKDRATPPHADQSVPQRDQALRETLRLVIHTAARRAARAGLTARVDQPKDECRGIHQQANSDAAVGNNQAAEILEEKGQDDRRRLRAYEEHRSREPTSSSTPAASAGHRPEAPCPRASQCSTRYPSADEQLRDQAHERQRRRAASAHRALHRCTSG